MPPRAAEGSTTLPSARLLSRRQALDARAVRTGRRAKAVHTGDGRRGSRRKGACRQAGIVRPRSKRRSRSPLRHLHRRPSTRRRGRPPANGGRRQGERPRQKKCNFGSLNSRIADFAVGRIAVDRSQSLVGDLQASARNRSTGDGGRGRQGPTDRDAVADCNPGERQGRLAMPPIPADHLRRSRSA